jgi:hypothetical protein
MADRLDVSLGTVSHTLHHQLNLEKVVKARGHFLTEAHQKERKCNARKLYERHLAKQRWMYVVSLDEAWIYLSDCGKPRAIMYREKGAKNFRRWVRVCKESFPKGFMVVAGYSYRGKLKIRRVKKNCKINSQYYQEEILRPIYEQEIPAMYGNDANMVRIHMDKASSHTSRSSLAFYREMEEATGIQAIPFNEVPVKSPDASPMDYCGFGLLKRALGKRRVTTMDGLWKAVKMEWDNIPLPVLQRSLLQWKLRCRAIVRNQGKHIEHFRTWRHRFF